MKPHLIRHIDWVRDNLDPTGMIGTDNRSLFLEWVPVEREEAKLGIRALLQLTSVNMRKLAAEIPELDLPVIWETQPADEAAYLNASTLIISLLGVMSGSVAKSEAHEFLENVEIRDPITPLSAYWLAECCSLSGLHEKAWHVIRTVWGGMLDQNATTFWESVRLASADDVHHALTTYTAYESYRISLCHSWSSTPVQWISRFLLGVEPLEPGYRKIAFHPQAVSGMREVSAVVPTPYGPIEVQYQGGSCERDGEWAIRLPGGVTLIPD